MEVKCVRFQLQIDMNKENRIRKYATDVPFNKTKLETILARVYMTYNMTHIIFDSLYDSHNISQ